MKDFNPNFSSDEVEAEELEEDFCSSDSVDSFSNFLLKTMS